MMCAWRESKTIQQAIKQFDGLAEVVVACSEKPWNGTGKRDNTAELAVQAGAVVKLFPWEDEKDQKNWIMSKMKDKKWVLMFAPDMFMEREDIIKLIDSLGDKRAYGCEMNTYYDLDNCEKGVFNNVAVRPNEVFEWSSRIKDFAYFDVIPVTMHHLSFVRTPEDMKTKITTWSHSPEVEGFYENWKSNNYVDIHGNPVKLVNGNLPIDVRRLYEGFL